MITAARHAGPTGAALAAALMLSACGHAQPPTSAAIRALQREARPIGRGPGFESRASGPVLGRCTARLGRRRPAHIELFAENRVVLLPAGIGVRGPVRRTAGRITAARCFGAVVTLDPTGVVMFRPHRRLTLSAVFHSWGMPLSPTRLAAFAAPPHTRVRMYVAGRRVAGDPRRLALSSHAEIVLEVGPFVPPHHAFTFPPTG